MIDENAVITQLAALLTPVENIQAVYQGVTTPQVYPAITIRPMGWKEDYADLRDTVENEDFGITVYVQLDPTSTMTDQSTLRDIVKEVREILGAQENLTLNGLIDSSRLTVGQYLFDQKEASIYFCDLTYQTRKRYSRFQ
jgi:hypothetical protein